MGLVTDPAEDSDVSEMEVGGRGFIQDQPAFQRRFSVQPDFHPLRMVEEQTGERLNQLYDAVDKALATTFRAIRSPWFLIGSAVVAGLAMLADSLDKRSD